MSAQEAAVIVDWTAFFSSILGALVAIIGSIAVAWMYIRNENKKSAKFRIYKRVQDTFFEKGLLPLTMALDIYGFSASFAIFDVNLRVRRCFILKTESIEDLETAFKQIRDRPIVSDLLTKKFELSLKISPTVQRFGNELQGAVNNTFQFYSIILSEALDVKYIKSQVEESPETFTRGLYNMGRIMDLIRAFLEKKLINIRDYVWNQELGNYEDFLELFNAEKYKNFLSLIESYNKYLVALWDTIRLPSEGAKQAEISINFTKWLSENMENNPLCKATDER